MTSSDLRIHNGLFLFSCSHSRETSFTFLVFFFFRILLLPLVNLLEIRLNTLRTHFRLRLFLILGPVTSFSLLFST